MKAKLLITSLSLIATSAYAQPSIPSVGMPPPTVRADMPRESGPSMPQPAMQRPAESMNSAVGSSSGSQPAYASSGDLGHISSGNGWVNAEQPRPPVAGGTLQPGMPAPASQQKVEGRQGTNDWYFPTSSAAGSVPASYSGGVPKPDVDGSLQNERVQKLPTPTGVSTPMPPLPANDTKGSTSVGSTSSTQGGLDGEGSKQIFIKTLQGKTITLK